jgi:hypothetical protein
MHIIRHSLWLAIPLAILPSCGVFGGGASGPANVDDLVSWVERVYVDSEMARQEVQTTLTRLQSLSSGKFHGTAVDAYQAFKEAATRAREQSEKLASSVQPMKRAASPVFDQWTQNIAGIHNPAMRRRSTARLDDARARYDRVVRTLGPAQSSFDQFNRGMQDHELFLGHDLNPASIESIQEEVVQMAKLAEEIDAQFAECLTAAKAYVDSAATPSTEGIATPSKQPAPAPAPAR